jgi:hypothetical protein
MNTEFPALVHPNFGLKFEALVHPNFGLKFEALVHPNFGLKFEALVHPNFGLKFEARRREAVYIFLGPQPSPHQLCLPVSSIGFLLDSYKSSGGPPL